jgi:hypothetical protein
MKGYHARPIFIAGNKTILKKNSFLKVNPMKKPIREGLPSSVWVITKIANRILKV